MDPYVILEREADGIPTKIGVIAFTSEIMMWTESSLEGKVYAEPIVDAAAKQNAQP